VETDKLVSQLRAQTVVPIEDGDLVSLLQAAEVVRAEDTQMAGMLRLLRLGGQYLIQEQTPDGRILVRGQPSREAAERFFEDRLETYERMWDGCGCHVEYFK